MKEVDREDFVLAVLVSLVALALWAVLPGEIGKTISLEGAITLGLLALDFTAFGWARAARLA